MATTDLNLLRALDVLLAERSVTRAARRLGLSVSAASRTLARLREATGDPLLVPAGRALVATPHAEELAGRVGALTREARDVLSPVSGRLDPARLERTFTLRANEGFLAVFSSRLVTAVLREAPLVRLRFTPKSDKEAGPLRDGRIDLEIGTAGSSGPEMRSRMLFRDRFVGVARDGHPILAGAVTPERYAACEHVVASRRGTAAGPVDDALRMLGLARRVSVVVPGFPDALNVARRSNLVAQVPGSCAGQEAELRFFDLPVVTPALAVSAMWHPRLNADPAHRWFREQVAAVCRGREG